MKFLTKELVEKFKQHHGKDLVIAKFFTPWANCTWFATGYDPEEKIFFGFVNLGDDDCAECGSFSLEELLGLTGPGGLKVERDKWFPTGKYSLQQVIDCRGHEEDLK